jgi:chromosome partitioning protein
MSIPVIAFFNNKGGVGKTTLAYHLAWMLADQGSRILAADLDPQCNLTASFLDEERVEELAAGGSAATIFGALEPLRRGTGDIAQPRIKTSSDLATEPLSERLALLLGDMALSTFEDALAEVWPKCLDRDERAFRITSAMWRVLQQAGQLHGADAILVDLGPNLGAINRAAIIAADFVVVPLGADLYSLQGMENLGPALQRWRQEWQERRQRNPARELELPAGAMKPIGYVALRHTVRLDRPVKAFDRWIARMPATYAKAVLGVEAAPELTIATDPHCLARLKDYRSLMPLAQEARKPMFQLKPADGAMGAHMAAVGAAYRDFRDLAARIARETGLSLSPQGGAAPERPGLFPDPS